MKISLNEILLVIAFAVFLYVITDSINQIKSAIKGQEFDVGSGKSKRKMKVGKTDVGKFVTLTLIYDFSYLVTGFLALWIYQLTHYNVIALFSVAGVGIVSWFLSSWLLDKIPNQLSDVKSGKSGVK